VEDICFGWSSASSAALQALFPELALASEVPEFTFSAACSGMPSELFWLAPLGVKVIF
jgi:hypothetical protein